MSVFWKVQKQLRPDKKHVNVWINSLNTNLKSTIYCAEVISKAFGGEKVYFAYNPTQGLMADVWEFLIGKLYFQKSTYSVAFQTLKEAIQEVEGPHSSVRVTIFAHSEGGEILSRAIESLSIKEQQMLEVYTFGNASRFQQCHLPELRHYISERDFIPFFADPMRYFLAYVWEIFSCPLYSS